jgi:hypothetical protein
MLCYPSATGSLACFAALVALFQFFLMFLDLTGSGVAANEFLVRFVALSATAIGVLRPTTTTRLRAGAPLRTA